MVSVEMKSSGSAGPTGSKAAPTVGVVKPRVVVKIKLSDKAIMKLDKIKPQGEPPEKRARLDHQSESVDKKSSKCLCGDPDKGERKCKHCRKKAKRLIDDDDDHPLSRLPTNLQVIPVAKTTSTPPPSATITSGLLQKQEQKAALSLSLSSKQDSKASTPSAVEVDSDSSEEDDDSDDSEDIQFLEEKPVPSKSPAAAASDAVSPLRLFRRKPAATGSSATSAD